MDLRNYNITVREILANREAKMLITREFPTLLKHPMLRMSQNMTLRSVLKYARGTVPPEKINQLIEQLKRL